jgi:hypothetical protein
MAGTALPAVQVGPTPLLPAPGGSVPMVSRDEAFQNALSSMYWTGYWTAAYYVSLSLCSPLDGLLTLFDVSISSSSKEHRSLMVTTLLSTRKTKGRSLKRLTWTSRRTLTTSCRHNGNDVATKCKCRSSINNASTRLRERETSSVIQLLVVLIIIIIVVGLVEPLNRNPVSTRSKAVARKPTLRNGSLALRTFLLVSLSTYFLLTCVPHCLTTSSEMMSTW